MALVQFILNDFPHERGDVAELREADALNRYYDGIVEFLPDEIEAEILPEPESPVEVLPEDAPVDEGQPEG